MLMSLHSRDLQYARVLSSVYTYPDVKRLGDAKVDDVEVCDRLGKLTQQEDDDDYDQHHLHHTRLL